MVRRMTRQVERKTAVYMYVQTCRQTTFIVVLYIVQHMVVEILLLMVAIMESFTVRRIRA
jgi:hypothetical protein